MKFRSQTKQNYRVEDEDTGDVYELREMTAAARDSYLQQHNARMVFGPEGQVTEIKNFDKIQAALLSRCMFKVETKEGLITPPVAVTEKQVQDWPASQCAFLHDKAQTMNGLSKAKKEAEPEKNG